MKIWQSLEQWLKDFKNPTRKQWEILTYVFILLSFVLVWVQRIPQEGQLKLDQGKMVYEGSMLNGKMNGEGKLAFKNGDTYKGQFKNGVFEGKGTYTAKDGWTYVGQFKKGLADGQGTLTTEDKTVYQGKFKQGIYQNAD